jgi:F-type H+-transporting ATPase subunit gamma
MPPLKEVRNRIKSVKNISQITRALEAVSASRVRRAQARVMASRAYADKAWEILINLQKASGVAHPLLTARPEVKKVMIVLITSDRGLAGSYNTNVMRVAERFEDRINPTPVEYITVGRKGRDTMIRSGANVVAEFSDLPAEPTIGTVAPITRMALDAYMSGEVDEVVIAYTDFVNMLTQRPVVRVWLPLSTDAHASRVAGDLMKEMPPVTEGALSYDYEPNAAAVLDEIVPRFTELQLYQALLESQASEHAARMAAMRNASDNATQLVADLTLEYNKARQASITSEILDIVGGANALQNAMESMADAILNEDSNLRTQNKPQAKAKPADESLSTAELAKGKGKSKSGGDDLTIIEGIGPKMSKALIDGGVATFAALSQKTEEELRSIISAAGMNFSPSLPTWAEQAKYAAAGDWDGLKKLQDELVGGRKA